MKKLLFITLSAMVFAPSLYAQGVTEPKMDTQFMPPMIPHPIQAFIPITPEKNACLMCHRPGVPGQAVKAGSPTPLPPSHVTDGKVNPNRYECLLCHAEVLPAKK